MPVTYRKIASVTVGSGGAASIDFTSIPATYTDLLIKISARTSNADGFTGDLSLRFNNNSSSVYSFRHLFAATSTPASGNGSALDYQRIPSAIGSSLTANTFNNLEIYIPNYTSGNNKPISADGSASSNSTADFTYQSMFLAGLWANVAAIDRVTLFGGNAGTLNFLQHSTATLYGIKNS
jgi:hypothetical protein